MKTLAAKCRESNFFQPSAWQFMLNFRSPVDRFFIIFCGAPRVFIFQKMIGKSRRQFIKPVFGQNCRPFRNFTLKRARNSFNI